MIHYGKNKKNDKSIVETVGSENKSNIIWNNLINDDLINYLDDAANIRLS